MKLIAIETSTDICSISYIQNGICENTIEEKIVKLHQEKRDLADSLLEGTDMSGRLSSAELINLIKEN